MKNFVFIAVNFNGYEYTKEYIQSIKKIDVSEEDNVEIIIVDNNSNIDNLMKLEKFCERIKNVKLITLKENLGYFKGLNQGIKTVEKNENTFLIIGNNDLTFERSFIKNFKDISYEKNTLVIAPNIITKDGRMQNPHVIKKESFFNKVKTDLYYSNYYVGQGFRVVNSLLKKMKRTQTIIKNDYPQMKIKRGIGACYILTPFFSDYFSELDDRVFMWGEEALLSNQVESVAGSILYVPTLLIEHHESASVKSIQSKKRYYMVKESYKIYRKYL